MIRRPPRSTRTDTLLPDTTRCRSVDVDRAAAVERSHHQHAVVHRQPHQEVARERNAIERHAEPARDFHLHHRQRDRIAPPALEDLVEVAVARVVVLVRSEEHTSELQSLMRISYAVFCLQNKKQTMNTQYTDTKNI